MKFPCYLTTEFENALEAVTVEDVAMLPGPHKLDGWFAVHTDKAGGIVAYFANEDDACRFRLAEVNRLLNG